MRASVASQMRAARSATASMTGCTSAGELEMTRSTSLMAVCCSRASFVSLNSRAFSMAMTAWLANVPSRVICLSDSAPG